MSRVELILVVIFGLSGHEHLNAESISYPKDGNLVGDKAGEEIGMTYHCTPNDYREPTTLRCEFEQVFLRYEEPETNESMAQLESQLANLDDQETRQLIAESKDELCVKEETTKYVPETMEREGTMPFGGGRQYVDSLVNSIDSFCTQKEVNVETYLDLAKAIKDISSRTCRIDRFIWSHTFSRSAENGWAVNEGPGGSCGWVTIGIFERAGEYGFLWNYSERRIVTSKEGEYCSAQEEDSVVNYSWTGKPKAITRECYWIKLGL